MQTARLLPLLLGLAGALVDDTLTEASFAAAMGGSVRVAFIKFHAEGCEPCRAMAPAWEAMGAEHKESTSFLVGAVDCGRSDMRAFCTKHDVRTLPSVLYFMAGDDDGELYEDETSLEKLGTYASELAATCFPQQTEPCEEAREDALKYLESMGSASVRRDFRGMQRAKREKRAEMERAYDAYEAKRAADPPVQAEVDAAWEAAQAASNEVQNLEKVLSWYRQVKAFLTAFDAAADEARMAELEAMEAESLQQEELNAAFFKGMDD